LRESYKFPSEIRKAWLINKIHTEFRATKHITDKEQIEFGVKYAQLQLDAIIAQATNFRELYGDNADKPSTEDDNDNDDTHKEPKRSRDVD